MTGGYRPWSKFNAHCWSLLNARRQLDEDQQLEYGNAFMRSLANKANASNPLTGLREVISIMDSGESLQLMLGVSLPDFLPRNNEHPSELPRFRLAVGE